MDYNKIFPDMVGALAKPGSDLLGGLSVGNADLWHGATGVAGEAGELLDAILIAVMNDCPIDRENLVEELGDMEFYLQMVRSNLGANRDDIVAFATGDDTYFKSSLTLFASLTVASSNLLDAVKKVVVYNKPINLDLILACLGTIENRMALIRSAWDITRDEVIEANVTKLATGPNARYKHGYTDQAAQDRADKAA